MTVLSSPAPTRHVLPQLNTLIDQLNAAVSNAISVRPGAIAHTLSRYRDIDALLTPEQQMGGTAHYTRHILHSHERGSYTLVALIWQPGQKTPTHGHHTWCAYGVLDGELHEEQFEWDAKHAMAIPVGEKTITVGYHCAAHAGLDAIHRLSNRGTARAVSLHVYGVNAERVCTHVNHVTPTRDTVPA